MLYLLTAFDGTDGGAAQRRQDARPAHIALGDELVASGNMLYGVAMLNDTGQMIGSAVLLNFASRDDLDIWLAREPYVVGKVWESIVVRPASRRDTGPLPPLQHGGPERVRWLVIGLDGTDPEALQRRLAVRPDHIALGDELTAQGHMLNGAAILNDAGDMAGSMLVMDFPTRADVDAWLAREPYVTGNVWETLDVWPCRIGPSYVDLHGVPAQASGA